MGEPVNFYSVSLDGILSEWLDTLREFAVDAVAVLGPDPLGGVDDRQVVCVHPPTVADVAEALARSTDFGARWRDSDAPLVAWQHIARGGALHDTGWRGLARCSAAWRHWPWRQHPNYPSAATSTWARAMPSPASG